ncbi:MAG: sensor histidine kinase [Actinomycetota bacterium]
MGSDWLEPTPTRAAVVATALGVAASALLVGCNRDRPLLAVAHALAAALGVLALAWSPTVAVVATGTITAAAPFLVACPYFLLYFFAVTLVVFAWADSTKVKAAVAGGFAVFAVNEILGEATEDGGFTVDPAVILPALLETALLAGVVVGLGAAVAVTRRQAAAMAALEQANTELALQAERHRIARDLHDVAAHHPSTIVVRTRTAAKLGDTESLAQAATFAGNTAGEALDAMRRIVTVLRTDQGATQPGLADLDEIAATTTEAGVATTLNAARNLVDELPRPVEVAIVRIVQEALANVVQHSEAGAADVTVVIDDGPEADTLVAAVEVVDDGPAATVTTGGSGLGLRGMRERVEALDGELRAGPTTAGGWRVAARLPLNRPHAATTGTDAAAIAGSAAPDVQGGAERADVGADGRADGPEPEGGDDR